MCNLPNAKDADRIIGTVKDDGYVFCTGKGWRICEVDAATPEGRAAHMARLLEEARDQGFEQGRAYVRAALGC